MLQLVSSTHSAWLAGALENAMHEAQSQQGSTVAQASSGPDNQRQQAPQATATKYGRNKYQRTTPSQVTAVTKGYQTIDNGQHLCLACHLQQP